MIFPNVPIWQAEATRSGFPLRTGRFRALGFLLPLGFRARSRSSLGGLKGSRRYPSRDQRLSIFSVFRKAVHANAQLFCSLGRQRSRKSTASITESPNRAHCFGDEASDAPVGPSRHLCRLLDGTARSVFDLIHVSCPLAPTLSAEHDARPGAAACPFSLGVQIRLWTPIIDSGLPRRAWAKACRAAGVPGRLVHDFRRTAVRNLERAGVPRSTAMKLTGHKTEAVYRRYAIVDSGMLQEAAAKLDQLENSTRTAQGSAFVAER